MPDPDYSDVTLILDRSGSMEPVATDLRGGINHFLDEQAKGPGKILVSIYQFDNEILTTCTGVPASDAPRLDESNYVPRANTALLDAMGVSIKNAGERFAAMPEDRRPGKVIFVIFTDGLENASRQYTKPQITEMVKHQTDAYNWQFMFLGANMDAIAVGQAVGIGRYAAVTFSGTPEGVVTASRMLSKKVGRYHLTGDEEVLRYTPQERDELKKE